MTHNLLCCVFPHFLPLSFLPLSSESAIFRAERWTAVDVYMFVCGSEWDALMLNVYVQCPLSTVIVFSSVRVLLFCLLNNKGYGTNKGQLNIMTHKHKASKCFLKAMLVLLIVSCIYLINIESLVLLQFF